MLLLIKYKYMEVWKSINDYESIYEISNLGRIKRVCNTPINRKNKILKNKRKKNGYLFVGLSNSGKVKYFHVHRLVAEAFIPNEENKPCVNHIDFNKENNKYDNLEWVTYKENSNHAIENLEFKRNPLKGHKHANSSQVSQYLNGKEVFVWGSYSCAAKYYGVTSSCISQSIRRKNISIGFVWEKCTEKHYLKMKDVYKTPPILKIDKNKRDLSKAREQKMKNIISKYTKEFLIKEGIKCLNENKTITRVIWDNYAKNNNILTYVPVSNRFNGFKNFKRIVLSSV